MADMIRATENGVEPSKSGRTVRESNSRKLSVNAVRTLRTPGKYGDGAGLWLMVAAPDRRSWVLRYTSRGRAREMTIGNAEHVSLAEARQIASDTRGQISRGVDPLDERHAVKVVAPTVPTFAEAAERYIAGHEAGWRNPKHRQQWRNTLATYAAPVMGNLPVPDVDTPVVLRVLEPIWHAKPETAVRLRGRIELVLDYARVQGWRDGPNPATWRGHLQLALPARNKVAPVEHHPALDWRELPAFMVRLREQAGTSAAALRFAILTAARSGEVRGMSWPEVDLSAALWTVPASRMKASRQHRVPLSDAALAELGPPGDGFVFPGQRVMRPLSDMSLTACLRRMDRGDLTAHGFRSTFRDWCAETGQPADVAEAALAHIVGDKTEAAYRRGDLLERRRRLMTDWAQYCS
jgi:integrase